MERIPRECPHCGTRLSKWRVPEESSWSEGFFLVCFNDDCSYFQKGWKWMLDKYEVNASYRFRYDPENDSSGPLPVWSAAAMREWIVEEDQP